MPTGPWPCIPAKGFIEDVKFIDNKSEFIGGNAKRQLIVFQVSNAKEDHPEANKKGVGYIKNVEVINYTAYRKSENQSLVSGTVTKDGDRAQSVQCAV